MRVDQRIDPHAADARLEAAAGGGNPVADFHTSLLAIDCAHLRRLQNSCIGVLQSRLQCGVRQHHRILTRGKMAEPVERNGRRTGGCTSSGRRRTCACAGTCASGGSGSVVSDGNIQTIGKPKSQVARLVVMLCSSTSTSMTTSAFGLSRSAITFSASATRSASARTINAICPL